MKNNKLPTLLFVFVFWISCTNVTPENTINKEDTSGKSTQLIINERVIDIGRIYADTIIEVKHYIKNVGKHNLIISDVIKACGCTSFILSNDTIQPQDSAILKSIINLEDKSKGLHRIGISILTNTPEKHHTLFTKVYIIN